MNEGKITKIPLSKRKTTFQEVSQGFSEEDALKEAARCLQCKTAPCNAGCPAGIDVKEFIMHIRNKDYRTAIEAIKENNSLPGVCGRVCPQEEQCQKVCILSRKGDPIQIGYLERFVADWELNHVTSHTLTGTGKLSSFAKASAAAKASGDKSEGKQVTSLKKKGKDKKQKKVAIIGSGPAGLTCAADLAKAGMDVHLFEALHKPGGVLVYGIPEFRLPKNIVVKEAEYIETFGVHVHTDSVIGRTHSIEELRNKGFGAFFIGVGAGLPVFLNIPGENLNGVYSANEFLTRVNLMKGHEFPEYDTPVTVGKKAAVIGAGNVSFDCARSALRLGAKEVFLVYRRSEKEMPARDEEIENAKEEGIQFKLLSSPLKILSDGKGNVKGLLCIQNRLGEPDASGRRRPHPIEGSEFILEVDTVIIAVGTRANPLLISTIDNLALTSKGYIKVNEKLQSSIPDIFAGGDIVSGSATVISAINQAKEAAQSISEYLSQK